MVKILVTGGLGGIGQHVVRNLLEEGKHEITIFDIKTKVTEAVARNNFQSLENVSIVYGDITAPETYPDLADLDAIIHLAFIIPPASETLPEEITQKVNVDGTFRLIEAAEKQNFKGKFIFASSVSLYGPTMWFDPPVTVDRPINPTDRYTRQKALCEKRLQESTLKWLILRVSGALNLKVDLSPENLKIMYSIPYDQRFEFVHPMDAALAFSNAVMADAENEVLIVAGGKKCRLVYHEIIERILAVFKLPPPKREKFSTKTYYTDHYDTTRSQEVLKFQTRDLDDFIGDFEKNLGVLGETIKFFAPIAKYFI
ncbi:MAG: NAD-dependent epimerase/dehydratase family protein [Candidatus Helarchaeota archaeon]